MSAVLYEPDLPCPAADGTILATDVYRPAAGGRHPPCSSARPTTSASTRSRGRWWIRASWAAEGYVVGIQDVRGRFGSEAEFRPYLTEAVDGAAAID